MGTFIGHVIPGSVILLFSFWRLIQICRRLQLLELSKKRVMGRSSSGYSGLAFFTSGSYPCCLECCVQWPVEGLLKVILFSFAMAGELFASTDYGNSGTILWIGDMQHLSVYFWFFICGWVDILVWKKVKFIPHGIDFITLANAFVVELIVFRHHLHGRSALDVHLHTLLLYIVAATTLIVLMEYKFQTSLVASLTFTYLLLLHGTWFYLIGFVLYVPTSWTNWIIYDLQDDDQITMATTIFTLNLAIGFLVTATSFVLTRWALHVYFQPRRWDVWDEALSSACLSPSSKPIEARHEETISDSDEL